MILGIRQLRASVHDVVDFVRFQNGRVILTKNRRPVAEIVPIPEERRVLLRVKRPGK